MYFDRAFGGMGGNPSALTSPGLDPQALSMLMAMSQGRMGGMPGGGMPGGPAMPQLMGQRSNVGAMPNMPQGPQSQPQSNLLQTLAMLDPTRLRSLLGMPGVTAGTGLASAMPPAGSGMPGATPSYGTGGLY